MFQRVARDEAEEEKRAEALEEPEEATAEAASVEQSRDALLEKPGEEREEDAGHMLKQEEKHSGQVSRATYLNYFSYSLGAYWTPLALLLLFLLKNVVRIGISLQLAFSLLDGSLSRPELDSLVLFILLAFAVQLACEGAAAFLLIKYVPPSERVSVGRRAASTTEWWTVCWMRRCSSSRRTRLAASSTASPRTSTASTSSSPGSSCSST